MLKLFKNVPLFAGMSDEILAEITGLARVKKYAPGEYLCHRGSEGNEFFVIQHGLVKIVLTSEDGKEIILDLLKDGDFLGELALIDGEPRSADAIAMEETEVIVLSRSCFHRLMRENEGIKDAVLTVLAARLRATNESLLDNFLPLLLKVTKKIVALTEKYASFAGPEQKEFDIPLSQQELADMVGATRESVNRCVRVLCGQGVIEWKKQHLKVKDIRELKGFLEKM
jgi:CRP-like cAMP-binding protein